MAITDQPSWRTPSYSSNGENCVEVAPTAATVLLRHSKHPDAGTITFTHEAWADFVRAARDDRQPAVSSVTITRACTDTLVTTRTDEIQLRFDEGEWAAFLAGAADGEFNFAPELLAVTR